MFVANVGPAAAITAAAAIAEVSKRGRLQVAQVRMNNHRFHPSPCFLLIGREQSHDERNDNGSVGEVQLMASHGYLWIRLYEHPQTIS